MPVFVAYGEMDEYNNVPVRESVRRLRSLNKSNITVKVYPGGDHAIEDPETHYVQEQLLSDLVEFVQQAGGEFIISGAREQHINNMKSAIQPENHGNSRSIKNFLRNR